MLNPDRDFDFWLDKYNNFLPSPQTRWCTRQLKLRPFEQWIKPLAEAGTKVFSYVAIRADEQFREGYNSTNSNIKTVLPFQDANVDKLGVIETEVGYAGGQSSKVSYEEVCKGNTGHAEVVRLSFDEKKISYKKILDLFFKMHDPTQKDMQFPDVGTQYRSEIFYETDEQKQQAEEVLNEKNKDYEGKIQTNISRIKNYCKAEEYHQKYIEKNR